MTNGPDDRSDRSNPGSLFVQEQCRLEPSGVVIHWEPAGFPSTAGNEVLLREIVAEPGVELGRYDDRLLRWLDGRSSSWSPRGFSREWSGDTSAAA
jgi:hypothetical protein